MQIYLLRHAIAEERDQNNYPDDAIRPLTETGIEKMVKIAKALRKMGLRIDLILSSPFLRAQQTAEIARKYLQLKKDHLVLVDQLAPLGDPGQLIAEIQTKYMVDRLMLVGHEPDLSNLTSLLMSGEPSCSIILKKGGICCLSIENLLPGKCAEMEWLMKPAQLVLI
jgi:phosphohistidine phosphatase